MILPARYRLDPPAKKRVHEAAQAQKMNQPPRTGSSRGGGCLYACPCRWNVQTAAVRQNYAQFRHIGVRPPPDHPQQLPFMSVALAGDRHIIRKALVRGSLR
jgi:hypothetical protein